MNTLLIEKPRRARAGARALLLALAAGLHLPAAAVPAAGTAAAPDFSIESVPAWISPLAAAAAGPPDAGAAMHYRVIDDQVLLTDSTQWRYSQQVRVVNSPAGLETAAQFEVGFDPSFQKLAFHRIEVVRGGQRVNKLDRGRVKLLQRETRLEQRIYDGVFTASVVLDDVRVGDEIDIAFSIKGANPVFGGRFVARDWAFAHRGPVAQWRYRLLAPRQRAILHRAGTTDIAVSTRELGEQRELVFERRNAPQFVPEEGGTWSSLLKDEVQLSEFPAWADVARWGQDLFDQAAAPSAALDAKAAEIRAGAAGDRKQQLLRALQLVQSEVRYFGTEIGPFSHRPASPDKVLAQRFGDCKDKVMLLVALLRRLDISATPILVSTTLKGRVGELLPSALAFDHVIARVDLDGVSYWLDPTRGHQAGPLERRQAVGFGKGLPLAAGVSALAELPGATQELWTVVRDRFVVTAFARPVELESRITYRNHFAEAIRARMAAGEAKELSSQIANVYARAFPKLKALAPAQIAEEPDDNAITLTHRYAVPDFWSFPEQSLLTASFGYWSLAEMLRFPGQSARRHGFVLSPGRYFHYITVQVPEDISEKATTQRFGESDRHFTFNSEIKGSKHQASYHGVLQVLADEVAPDDWETYTTKVLAAAKSLDVYLQASAIPLASLPRVKQELEKVEADIKRKKVRATTKMQQQALIRTTILTHQIEGRRLSPALMSEALSARAIQSDFLGNPEAARKDFDAALALAPDDPELLNGAAVNALLLDDTARALRLTEQVLKANPKDVDARYVHAQARFMSADYRGAKAELEALLQDPGTVRRGYALIYLSLAARHLREDVRPTIAALADQAEPNWPRPLIDLAAGKATEQSVLAAAKDGEQSREQLCEAYYYLGLGYLADGDTRRARNYFRESISQGITEYIEDGRSRRELAKLERR